MKYCKICDNMRFTNLIIYYVSNSVKIYWSVNVYWEWIAKGDDCRNTCGI